MKVAALRRLLWKQHQPAQKPKEHLSRIMIFFLYSTDVLLHDRHFSECFSGTGLRQSWKRGQGTDDTVGAGIGCEGNEAGQEPSGDF